MPSLTMIIVSS